MLTENKVKKTFKSQVIYLKFSRNLDENQLNNAKL